MYYEVNIPTTQKQEAENNNIENKLPKENETTINDDKHHIEVLKDTTHITPELAAELNHTLWKNVNITVLDAIMQTWLLNIDHKDPNKSIEIKNMTAAKHISSGNSNDDFNVTYTNVTMYATENPINSKITKEITKTSPFTESPIREEEVINLDEGIVGEKISNITYISKNLKKGLPKFNLSEISNASESEEDFPIKMNTTQTLYSKDEKKGLPKSNPTPVTKIIPPRTTIDFTTKAEILTTTETSTKSNVSNVENKGIQQFKDLNSKDISQVSEELYVEPFDSLKHHGSKYVNNELIPLQPQSEIVHNFLGLSKEGLNQDSRSLDTSEIFFKAKDLKKGLSKPISMHHDETTTGNTAQDIAYEGETTEQNTVTMTMDKITTATEENLTVTTEEITNSTTLLSAGTTTEEVTQNDDIEFSTKLNNAAESLILTTDKVKVLEVAKKGVERHIDDAEASLEDSLDLEKEQVAVYV